MKILLTNDDSIHSVALQRLAGALQKKGWEVFVVAPDCEKSGVGRACCLSNKIVVAPFNGLGCPAWTVSGTPLDCVNIGLSHLLKGQDFDVVISGINWGVNVSIPTVFSSGTVGGALEGAAFGIPSIAVSQCLPGKPLQYIQKKIDYLAHDGLMKSIDMAVIKTVDYAEKIAKTSESVVHNINYPYPLISETLEERTQLCNIMRGPGAKFPVYGSLYNKVNDEYVFSIEQDFSREPTPGSDIDALFRGVISHSIIDLDRLC